MPGLTGKCTVTLKVIGHDFNLGYLYLDQSGVPTDLEGPWRCMATGWLSSEKGSAYRIDQEENFLYGGNNDTLQIPLLQYCEDCLDCWRAGHPGDHVTLEDALIREYDYSLRGRPSIMLEFNGSSVSSDCITILGYFSEYFE